MIGLAIEIVCTLGVVSGVADRASAFIIAGYCAATAAALQAVLGAGRLLVRSRRQGSRAVVGFSQEPVAGRGFLLIVVGLDGSGLERLYGPSLRLHPSLWECTMSRPRPETARALLAPVRRREGISRQSDAR